MLKQLPGCRNHGSDVGPPFEMLQEFLRGWGRAKQWRWRLILDGAQWVHVSITLNFCPLTWGRITV